MRRILGAIIRAILVAGAVAFPAFLLPSATAAAKEISLIAGLIAAAFTLFEYGSSHPGLIHFRFAPPYNRFRFSIFVLLTGVVVFLCRASVGEDPIGTPLAEFAERAAGLVDTAFSPFRVMDTHITPFVEEEVQPLVRRAAAAVLVIGLGVAAFYTLLLWSFRWPFGRDNFNIWTNLPTLVPTAGRDVAWRLGRDGGACILLALALLYLIPVVASRSSGWFDPDVLASYQPLIWGCLTWVYLPVVLFLRGAALLKLGWLVRRARPR